MDAKNDKLTDSTEASNYVMDPQKYSLDKYAAILADAGFDVIIGSDGSHTAQPFGICSWSTCVVQCRKLSVSHSWKILH
jgi:hypothetical protein